MLTDWNNSTNGMQYGYDGYGRLTCLTDYNGAYLTYGYDGYGRTTSQQDYHGATTAYMYTADGRMSTVTATGSLVWAYSYDAYKQLTKVDLPNGMKTEYAYDALGRQTAIHHMDGFYDKQNFTYAFANNGNITQSGKYDTGPVWQYEYDNRSRLTKAERYIGTTLLHRYNYAYDNEGNMLSKAVYDATAQTTTTTTMAYDNANELTSTTSGGVTTTYAYDAWGNTTSKTDGTYTATYAYKYGSKLGSMTSTFPGEADVTYEYNGAEQRIAYTTGGITKRYRWDDGWNVLNEENGSGVLTRTYCGNNIAHVDGSNLLTGTWEYYTKDNLGNSRGLWNDDSINYATLEYTPYGELYATTGNPALISHRFTGRDWDDSSNLYYTPYRYYSPINDRWLTRDPSGNWMGTILIGVNLYVYAGDNPVDQTGPTGLRPSAAASTIKCKKGKLVIVNNNSNADKKCTDAHEQVHINDWIKRYGKDLCKGVKDGDLPMGGKNYGEFLRQSECRAYAAGKKCREDALKKGCKKMTGAKKKCFKSAIKRDNDELKAHRCNTK